MSYISNACLLFRGSFCPYFYVLMSSEKDVTGVMSYLCFWRKVDSVHLLLQTVCVDSGVEFC